MKTRPESDIDLFSTEAIENPYPLYKQLRDLGPAVWMTRYDMWVIPRFKDVKHVQANWRQFTTSKGVAMSERVNAATSGLGRASSLTSDPPLHDQMRSITEKPISRLAVRKIKGPAEEMAGKLVADLCQRGSIDAITDLAQHLPHNLVIDLIGLPPEGAKNVCKWATASFNATGPMNTLGAAAAPLVEELHSYCQNPGNLKKDGWADLIFQAADNGEIDVEHCPGMMRDYIGPSLDTTIFSIGHLLRYLGENRDQWDLLKGKKSLISGAINETLRIEAPIRSHTRYVQETTLFDDIEVPAGDWLMVLYGSANRDEREWDNPDSFEVTRKARDQISFGYGSHICPGMHLAKMQMTAILGALLEQVEYFETGTPIINQNNVLRGYDSLPLSLHPQA